MFSLLQEGESAHLNVASQASAPLVVSVVQSHMLPVPSNDNFISNPVNVLLSPALSSIRKHSIPVLLAQPHVEVLKILSKNLKTV